MACCAKPAELYPLSILDLLRVTVAPFDGHFAIGVGVDEHIEGAVAVELGEKGYGGRDLSENRCDLGLDLRFRLVGGGSARAWRHVLLVALLRRLGLR